jgi:hypothetical protein
MGHWLVNLGQFATRGTLACGDAPPTAVVSWSSIRRSVACLGRDVISCYGYPEPNPQPLSAPVKRGLAA